MNKPFATVVIWEDDTHIVEINGKPWGNTGSKEDLQSWCDSINSLANEWRNS